MPLSENERILMLEELAQDKELKATQRLRALEELGRIEARRSGGVAAPEPGDEEMPPDPMADLDEIEEQRRKRQRRAAA